MHYGEFSRIECAIDRRANLIGKLDMFRVAVDHLGDLVVFRGEERGDGR